VRSLFYGGLEKSQIAQIERMGREEIRILEYQNPKQIQMNETPMTSRELLFHRLCRREWKGAMSNMKPAKLSMPNCFFAEKGLLSLFDRYEALASAHPRTAKKDVGTGVSFQFRNERFS
jgi:hypothetical protein